MFPGGKGGRCIGLTTLHLHVPIGMKSGSLNLLEPSGPIQACNGIALRVPLISNIILIVICINTSLTFKNHASYIWDGRTPTLQICILYIFFNNYKY